MDIRKIKEAYKIYDNVFGYLQRIKALLTILNSDEAEYPSNYLLTIAKRDLKSASKNISKTWDILHKIILEERQVRKG